MKYINTCHLTALNSYEIIRYINYFYWWYTCVFFFLITNITMFQTLCTYYILFKIIIISLTYISTLNFESINFIDNTTTPHYWNRTNINFHQPRQRNSIVIFVHRSCILSFCFIWTTMTTTLILRCKSQCKWRKNFSTCTCTRQCTECGYEQGCGDGA